MLWLPAPLAVVSRRMRQNMHVFAAIAAGLLVGFFVGGLDSSSFVGSVMTTILAVVTAILGATKLKSLAADDYDVRVAWFSAATLVALFAGIWFKSNHPLAPTLASEYAQIRAAGYSEAEARDLAVYSVYKIVPKDRTVR